MITEWAKLRIVFSITNVFGKDRCGLQSIYEAVSCNGHLSDLVIREFSLLVFHQFTSTKFDNHIFNEIDGLGNGAHQQESTQEPDDNNDNSKSYSYKRKPPG